MSEERNTELANLFFPVETQPIFLAHKAMDTGNQLFLTARPVYGEVPHFHAIVDTEQNHVFSVVAEGYSLVTNREAVELGKKCFRSVFSQTTTDGMTVFNIISPKSRSFCHIDFVHEKGGFEPWKGDKWVPFMRVTNSYNRTKPLRFDLGFCRWICTNGMISGKKSITFRYLHTHGDMAKTVEFKTSFGDLKSLEAQFIESLHNLKRFYVPKNNMLPIVCRVFEIRISEEDLKRPRRLEQLIRFRTQINASTDKYFTDFGENGYAALNVITDFASRPDLYISQASMVDQLQKRSGDWVDDFLTEIQNVTFDYDIYLKEFKGYADILNAKN